VDGPLIKALDGFERNSFPSFPHREDAVLDENRKTPIFSNAPHFLTRDLFLVDTLIKEYDAVALNRLGTHPVENFLGMVRLACHENHSWDRFLSAVAKGSLAGDLLAAHGLKQHIRRDFSVGGTKAIDQRHCHDKLAVGDLLKHGMDCLELLMTHDLENKESVVRLWTQDLFTLEKRKNDKHFPKLYNPGPGANDAILSRIL
jgi:hypothetical protein